MISCNNIRNTGANLLRSETHEGKKETRVLEGRRGRRSNGTMTKTSLNFRHRLKPYSLAIVIDIIASVDT